MPLAFFSDHAAAADAWDRAIDINLKGVLNGICAVYDQMIRPGPRPHRQHLVDLRQRRHRRLGRVQRHEGSRAGAVRLAARRGAGEDQGHRRAARPGSWAPGLGAGVVNPHGARRAHRAAHRALRRAGAAAGHGGGLHPEETDVDDVRYWAITPEDLVRQIVYAIDQPWGVTISDITVRATGEDYIL